MHKRRLQFEIYETEEGSWFRAYAPVSDEVDVMVDVTARYEVVAAKTDDGRSGFLVIDRREQSDGV